MHVAGSNGEESEPHHAPLLARHAPLPRLLLRWATWFLALLLLLLVPWRPSFSGHQLRPSAPNPLTIQLSSPEMSTSLCVVNVAQIVARLSNQGALINTLVNVCDYKAIRRRRRGPVTEEEKQRCANFLMLTIINTDLIAGLITASLTACSQSLNVPANCATNIASMVGMTVLLAQAGLQIELDCVDNRNVSQKVDAAAAELEDIKLDVKRSAYEFLADHGVRTGVLPASPAVPKNTVYSNTALCFGCITLIGSFTMRLGVVLADAVSTCPHTEGIGPKDCALDMMSVLGLLSVIIRFSGLASNACVAIVGDSNPTGQCVVASSSIPAAAFSLTAAAGNVEAACNLDGWDPAQWPLQKQTGELLDNGDVILPIV